MKINKEIRNIINSIEKISSLELENDYQNNSHACENAIVLLECCFQLILSLQGKRAHLSMIEAFALCQAKLNCENAALHKLDDRIKILCIFVQKISDMNP